MQLLTVGHSIRLSEKDSKTLAERVKAAKMTKNAYVRHKLALDKPEKIK